jgi:hypothetical protein
MPWSLKVAMAVLILFVIIAALSELGENSDNFIVCLWVSSGDYWNVK